MSRNGTLRFAFGSLLVLSVPLVAVAGDDLVRQVRDGHRAARESIQTLTATLTSEQIHPDRQIVTQAKYSRSGGVARIREGREGGHTEDLLMKGGEIRHIGRSWKAGKAGPSAVAFRAPGNAFFGPGDVWREMLIELTGPAGGQLDLDQLLTAADGPVRADREKLDGRECVRLRFSATYPSGAKERVTLWHDIGRNYLVCRVLVERPDLPTSRYSVLQVLDFIEPQPGVVFPVKVRREHFRNGEMFSATVATLTDVTINKLLPPDALALPQVPRGTTLHDRIEGKEGPIDSDWKPLGVMRPAAPPPLPPAPKVAPADAPAVPSTSEPVSTGRWVLSGSLVLLVLAAGVAVVSRVRARRNSTA